SIASPSFRSNSTTAPRPSFSSWLTCIVALPSTALTVTGMSYTASSSRAPCDALLSLFALVLSTSSPSSILVAIDRIPDGHVRVQQVCQRKYVCDLLPQRSCIPLRCSILPGNANIAGRHCVAFDDLQTGCQVWL